MYRISVVSSLVPVLANNIFRSSHWRCSFKKRPTTLLKKILWYVRNTIINQTLRQKKIKNRTTMNLSRKTSKLFSTENSLQEHKKKPKKLLYQKSYFCNTKEKVSKDLRFHVVYKFRRPACSNR